MSFKKVPFGEIGAFNVIVEVPTGSQKKYAHDPHLDVMKLTRVLYDEARFPFNYGYVAATEADDGESLDTFVLSTHPITRGTMVTCRAVGMIELTDRGKDDHKIIAIPLNESRLEHIQDLDDLPKEYIPIFQEFYRRLAKQWRQDLVIKSFANKDKAHKELLRTQVLE